MSDFIDILEGQKKDARIADLEDHERRDHNTMTDLGKHITTLKAELKHIRSRWDWTEYWFGNLYPADWGRCQAKYDQTKTGAQPVARHQPGGGDE